MTIKELQQKVYQTNEEKGWHEFPLRDPDTGKVSVHHVLAKLALIHTEISEAKWTHRYVGLQRHTPAHAWRQASMITVNSSGASITANNDNSDKFVKVKTQGADATFLIADDEMHIKNTAVFRISIDELYRLIRVAQAYEGSP